MPPVMGNVVRAYKHFFVKADGVHPEAMLQFTNTCRAVSTKALPAPGNYLPCDGAAFRMAWAYGYGLRLTSKGSMPEKDFDSLLLRWRQSAACFPVRFPQMSTA